MVVPRDALCAVNPCSPGELFALCYTATHVHSPPFHDRLQRPGSLALAPLFALTEPRQT